MEDKEMNNKPINNEEIDLAEIVQKIWKNRKFIIKVTLVFTTIGLITAIFTPNVYTASSTMILQTGQKTTGGSLGGLAAIAGINLGNMSSGEVLSPNVYPKILTNINFQRELIYSKFDFQGVNEPITLYDFYTDKKYQHYSLFGKIKKYTIGLPGVIISIFRGDETDYETNSEASIIQSLTAKEKIVVGIISENLSLSVNSKDGLIYLSANMSQPLVAAELAQKGQELLQKYITEFKVAKVASNLEFVEKSFNEAKKNFENKQAELARFRDANKSFSSAIARTQEEKLLSEYNLLYGIYTELAKQYEQAKISVTETTPILTVIEPVVVPIDKSKPSRTMLLIIFSILGLILGALIVIFIPYLEENFIPNSRKKWFITKIV